MLARVAAARHTHAWPFGVMVAGDVHAVRCGLAGVTGLGVVALANTGAGRRTGGGEQHLYGVAPGAAISGMGVAGRRAALVCGLQPNRRLRSWPEDRGVGSGARCGVRTAPCLFTVCVYGLV